MKSGCLPHEHAQEFLRTWCALLQDVGAIRVTLDKLMATLDEINMLAFVLMKVLVVTAPRKKQGCEFCPSVMFGTLRCIQSVQQDMKC